MLGLDPRAVHEQSVCPELQPPLWEYFKTTVLCSHPDLLDQSFGGGAQESVLLRLTQDCVCASKWLAWNGLPSGRWFPTFLSSLDLLLLLVGVQDLLKAPRSRQILLCPHLPLRSPLTPSVTLQVTPVPWVSDRLSLPVQTPTGTSLALAWLFLKHS